MVAHLEVSRRLDQFAELPLWSAEGIAAIRDGAKDLHYPLSRTQPALCDALAANRDVHVSRGAMSSARTEAAYRAASDQASAAELRRSDALGRVDAELDKAADSFLSMLALALDRRPNEVAAMLTPFLVQLFSTTWDNVNDRLDALETAAAEQLESAL